MTTGQNWFDTNEARRYPLADDADVGGLPDAVIADLRVVIPAALLAAGDLPRLVSISSGASYISVVIMLGGKEIAWYGGAREIHTPLPLEPLASGVGGFIVFGTGAADWRGVAVLPRGTLAVPAFSASFDSGVSAITFVSDGSATPLTAVIRLDLGPGINVDYRGTVAGRPNVIEFSIPDAIDPIVNAELLGNCGKNAQGNTCAPALINTVNGVRADKNGKLTIKVVNNTTSALTLRGGGGPVGTLVTALSLTRACEDRLVQAPPPDVSGGLVKKC